MCEHGGFPADQVRVKSLSTRLPAEQRRGGTGPKVKGDRQMSLPGENIRETAGEDPAARRWRERQVDFPQTNADHPRPGLRPASPRGLQSHNLQQCYQR